MRTHPAQVVDRQAELVDRLGDPRYHEYVRVFITSKVPDIETEAAAGLALALQHHVKTSYAYHVEEDMTALVQHAANDLASITQISEEMFPTQAGFVWFDRPLPLVDAKGMCQLIRVVQWTHGTTQVGDPSRPVSGVGVAMYTDLDAPDDVTLALESDDPGSIEGQRSKLGRLVLTELEFFAYGQRIGARRTEPSEEEERTEGLQPADNMLRLLAAYWLLLGQTIVSAQDEPLPRPFQKRARRTGVPDRVTVVQLRRVEHASRREGESYVEWSHRWVVRGHWRNQACGPGRQEHRLIWVAPFIKGPADRPLAKSERVYTLKR